MFEDDKGKCKNRLPLLLPEGYTGKCIKRQDCLFPYLKVIEVNI
jgi:hypothetical protein